MSSRCGECGALLGWDRAVTIGGQPVLSEQLAAEQARIATLTAALEWYADRDNYFENGAAFSRPRMDAIGEDLGARARAALEAGGE